VSARTKARKRAVDALYAAELRDGLATELLDQTRLSVADRQNQDEIFDYASLLVTGVVMHQIEIDELIAAFSQNWPIDRMPVIDRNILRVATFEICYHSDIPIPVAISEAASLATELSTDNSAGFIKGILASIAATRTTL
jgi:N utilization substance protein B